MTIFRSLLSLVATLAVAVESHALTFRLTGDELVGDPKEIRTKYEDTFNDLGRIWGLGFRELTHANPEVLPWVPGEGTKVTLPLQFILPEENREGEAIVLNLAELRMYHMLPEKGYVRTYAVGIGREGWQTPIVEARVTSSTKDPSWTPPASIRAEHAAMGDILPRVVAPGPNNPLGRYAVRLSVPGYLIHGSNKKIGVGMRVSHGCMRLYDGDIEELATSVKPGTPVRIINEPVKAGWLGKRLFLEVHPPLEEFEAHEVNVKEIVGRALARRPETIIDVDWNKVEDMLAKKDGIPQDITLSVPTTAAE